MLVWPARVCLAPIVFLEDVVNRWRARSRTIQVLRKATFAHHSIAVIALYQSGHVRADVLRLLLSLRQRGVYVIAVNTGQLDDGGARLPVDTYVERPNYGRDFASYKAGLEIAAELTDQLPEMYMFNDSVFYISGGLDDFLDRLAAAPYEVCGATESLEVSPHIMSYCLRFSEKCTNSDAFSSFWARFRPSNVRPMTILFGEVALSGVLRKAGLTLGALVPFDAIQTAKVNGGDGVEPLHESSDRSTGQAFNVTHKAPSAVIALGAPLIKLDLIARGKADVSEIESIVANLLDEEESSFRRLVDEREPSEAETPQWRRVANDIGLA